jgi:hypothetical protein
MSGVADGGAMFVSSSGTHYVHGFMTRVSGNNLDGNYAFTVTVPKYSEQGTWHVFEIYLRDNVNNEIRYNESQLLALGYPTTFTNTGQ